MTGTITESLFVIIAIAGIVFYLKNYVDIRKDDEVRRIKSRLGEDYYLIIKANEIRTICGLTIMFIFLAIGLYLLVQLNRSFAPIWSLATISIEILMLIPSMYERRVRYKLLSH